MSAVRLRRWQVLVACQADGKDNKSLNVKCRGSWLEAALQHCNKRRRLLRTHEKLKELNEAPPPFGAPPTVSPPPPLLRASSPPCLGGVAGSL